MVLRNEKLKRCAKNFAFLSDFSTKLSHFMQYLLLSLQTNRKRSARSEDYSSIDRGTGNNEAKVAGCKYIPCQKMQLAAV